MKASQTAKSRRWIIEFGRFLDRFLVWLRASNFRVYSQALRLEDLSRARGETVLLVVRVGSTVATTTLTGLGLLRLRLQDHVGAIFRHEGYQLLTPEPKTPTSTLNP